jgi:hypothetical protein
MTRAEIELLLINLAETTRSLRESHQLIRETAERIARSADYTVTMSTRIEAALDEFRRRGDEETDT